MDRLDIYTRALELALDKPLPCLPYQYNGLCHYLVDAILQIYHATTYQEAFSNDDALFEQSWEYVKCGINGESNAFPEIFAHKPEDFDDEKSDYWFPISDEGHVKRVAILQEAIELAKADMAAKEDFDANHFDGDSSYNE